MKLSIELKEGKEFEFHYEFGENANGTCIMPIHLDSLRLFVKLCDVALMERHKDYENKFREVGLRALIEEDLDVVDKWVKKEKNRRSKGD